MATSTITSKHGAPNSFAGKRVLVTGASMGIGRATALAFGAQGASVTVVARGRAKLEEVVKLLPPGKGFLLQADISKPEECTKMVHEAIKLMGGLDVLVNNGAVGLESMGLPDSSPEYYRNMFDLHVVSAVATIHAALPELIANQGSVINVSSVAAGGVVYAASAPYAAAKAAQDAMVRCLALTHAPSGVRFNSVAPGPTHTAALDAMATHTGAGILGSDKDQEQARQAGFAAIASILPLQKLGQAEDVAALITFLASPAAAFITGQVYHVDGGVSLTSWFQEKPAATAKAVTATATAAH